MDAKTAKAVAKVLAGAGAIEAESVAAVAEDLGMDLPIEADFGMGLVLHIRRFPNVAPGVVVVMTTKGFHDLKPFEAAVQGVFISRIALIGIEIERLIAAGAKP